MLRVPLVLGSNEYKDELSNFQFASLQNDMIGFMDTLGNFQLKLHEFHVDNTHED